MRRYQAKVTDWRMLALRHWDLAFIGSMHPDDTEVHIGPMPLALAKGTTSLVRSASTGVTARPTAKGRLCLRVGIVVRPPSAEGTAGAEGQLSQLAAGESRQPNPVISPVERFVDEVSGSCDVSRGPPGAPAHDALHRRARPPPLRGRLHRADGEVRVPRREEARQLGSPRAQMPLLSTGWVPSEPAWLYLPHAGIGDGSQFARDAQRGGHREQTGTGSAGSPRPQCDARIRGQLGHCRLPGPLASATASTACASGDAAISGPAHRLGPVGVLLDASIRKQRARLEAQHSTMAQSLADHAERVAKRHRSGDALPAPSAAARLAALRQRIAARCDTVSVIAPGVSADCADAAARAAHHGCAHGSRGDGHRMSV